MKPVQASTLRAVVDATFSEHRSVFEDSCTQLTESIEQAATALIGAYQAQGKAILFGNGGSMSDALHIEGELVNRFAIDRQGVPAVALGSPASLSATANDYSYEDAFARMLTAHAGPNDVAIGISTSGNSENVIRALQRAKELGLPTIALTGGDGGKCKDIAEVSVIVPSSNTPRIQEMHILAGHILCDLVERVLFRSAEDS